ncbi:TniQ family protein [Rhizobium leguminosarum]|uniref:TniQ family protein n=1 Tax=Rhizobium leguminosarum TaxID=384 RepID=UPI0013F14CD1|nr:TniQ family protein [Rhizobium leguminosarum]
MLDRLTSPFSTWAVEPAEGEPAHGYVNRLVDGEGHNSLRVYGNWIELNGRNIVPEAMLETVCSLPISEERRNRLRHATAIERDGSFVLARQRFSPRDLSFAARRWCPACLAESAHHRTWWDIVALRRCPYHDTKIMDRDPDGMPVKWWWPRFDVTKRGHELAGERKPKVLRRGTFAAYLIMRMGFEDRWEAPLLDCLDATVAIDVCHLVGRLISNPRTPTIPDLATRTIDVGYRALRENKDHLVSVVAAWLRKRLTAAEIDTSYSSVFGWAHRMALNLSDEKARRTVLSAFRKAHAYALTGAEPSPADADRTVTLTELSAELGIDRRGIASLVSALAANGNSRSTKRRVSLDSLQAEALRREIEDLLTRDEAGALLGLPGWAVGHLASSGYLASVKYLGRGKPGLRFTRKSVTAILDLIAALPTTPGKSRKFITCWRVNGLHPGQLAVSVLGGKAAIVRRNNSQHGFCGLSVQATVAEARRSSALPSDDKRLSMADIEAITNLNRPTVQWLVRKGHLGESHRTKKLCLLDRETVETFAGRYRNAIEFAEPLGVTVPDLLRRLAGKGVKPFLSAIDGHGLNTVIDAEAARIALGLSRNPSVIEDEGLVRFWTRIVETANRRGLMFKFPDRLPSCGQRVWRGDRYGSVLFQFDPVSRELHYSLIGRRFLEDTGDRGWRHRIALDGNPETIIDIISKERTH